MIDRIPGVVRNEERVMPEITPEFIIRVGGNAKSPNMNYLCIEECLWMGFDKVYQCANEILRFSATGSDEYSITPMDMAKYCVLRNTLIRI